MKRTIIRIEKEDGAPPEIEINGRPMKGPFERAALYAAALFVAIGILFLVVYVVLPLLGIALGIVFALVGIGIVAFGIILVLALLGGVLGTLLDKLSRGQGRRDNWYE